MNVKWVVGVAVAASLLSAYPVLAEDAVARQFELPVDAKVSMAFGQKVTGEDKTSHHGIDFPVKEGRSVKASAAGKVEYVGKYGGYDKVVIIDHGDDLSTLYAHLGSTKVEKGQTVSKGQLIATSGKAKANGKAQLHFEIRKHGKPVDPAAYLQ